MTSPVGDGDLVPERGTQPEIQPPSEDSLIADELAFQEFKSFQGPLPPPEVLGQYEKVLPGLADRIVTMAESNVVHIQVMNQKSLRYDSLRSFAGLTAGLVVTALFGIIAFRLISEGETIPGIVLGSVDLVALITVFIIGRPSSLQ